MGWDRLLLNGPDRWDLFRERFGPLEYRPRVCWPGKPVPENGPYPKMNPR